VKSISVEITGQWLASGMCANNVFVWIYTYSWLHTKCFDTQMGWY
jgi:hypothetical protein